MEDSPTVTDSTRRLSAFAAVMAVAAAIVLFRLGEPDWTPAQPHRDVPKRYVWDECLYGFTAHRMLTGDPDVWRFDAKPADLVRFDTTDFGPHAGYAVYHPPLALFTMTASSWAFGWSAFAVRLPGALAGLAIVACTWLLARRMFDDLRVASLAALLVALDGVWFTISRVAIPHAYVAAATAGAAVTALVAWQDEARRTRFTVATGALCGLGLAFKTSMLTALVVLGAALLVRTWTYPPNGGRRRALAVWAASFLAIPPAIYLASWLPFFLVWDRSWADFVEQHSRMRAWHASMPEAMGPSTPWWTWPVFWKPVRLFEEAGRDGTLRTIVAHANPFLWWTAVAAVPIAASRFVRRRSAGDAWLVAGYLGVWLVYAFLPRFGFSYYLLPAAPFAAVAVASALSGACGTRPASRTLAFSAFGALAAGAFAARYATLSAWPLER